MGNVVDFDPRKKRKRRAGGSGPSRPHPRFDRKQPTNGQLADWIPGVALAAGITILATAMLTSPMASGIGCDIKGNVSTTGERIFHVPGQEYYRETVVNPLRGERWFCSEEAAREAGWRKAYR
ncbi:sunset domain-containing protein [Sinorhizobium fredii]|uniref:sunset domain-containing protein n=1 Tax=Rhizobium fredii TaxID=380 RepID=UPI003390815B